MAALRVKDLKMHLATAPTAADTVAKAGVSMRDMERAVKAMGEALGKASLQKRMEKHGWTRTNKDRNWWSPDGKHAISEQCMVDGPKAAEEVFLGWLRKKNNWQPPPARTGSTGTIESAQIADGPIVCAGKIGPEVLDIKALQKALNMDLDKATASAFFRGTLKPTDPLKWLDHQVEEVCRQGRLQ